MKLDEKTETALWIFKKNQWRLLIFFGIVWGITSITQNNYRSVREIAPELLKTPFQKEIKATEHLQFQNEDGFWELTFLDEYEINGLIVSKIAYDQPSFYHTLFKKDVKRHAWPFDFALVWGSNVADRAYQRCSFFSEVSSGGRLVYFSYPNGVQFRPDEFSNNHLIMIRKDLKKRAARTVVGDQIQIKGKLVRFKLKVLKPDGKTVAFEDTGESSRVRSDNGCEIIYVEDIQILKKANRISRFLFQASRMVLIGLMSLILFFWFYSRIILVHRCFFERHEPPRNEI